MAGSILEAPVLSARGSAEASLEAMARTFAEARGLAFKVVPMSDGPEPRVGLGFYPSKRLRDVAMRLAYRPALGLRFISQLPVSEVVRWGQARAMVIYRMRSEVVIPWPADPVELEALMDLAVEQARRSKR
jgi:hypothetical protein